MNHKTKKMPRIALVILGILFFSGCTFQGQSDGGVYKSSDAGESFQQKGTVSKEKGEKKTLFNSEIQSLTIDPNSSSIIYAGTKSDGLFRSSDAGETWIKNAQNFNKVTDVIINPQNSNELYITTDLDGKGRILKTTDKGETWFEPFTQSTGVSENWRLAMDPNNPMILYAGDSNGGIYKTDDAGQTWRALFWAKSGIRRIAIDNANTSRVYFGTTSSGAFRTDDAGGDFVEIATKGITYEITVHPYEAGKVYLVDKEGLKKSGDAGDTFEIVNTLVQPEKLKARVVAIDPSNDAVIYLVSGSAFHKSVDSGRTWAPVDLKISRLISSLVIDPRNTSIIYLGAAEKAGSGGGLVKF